MGWARYQLPTPFLVEQAFLTHVDLRRVGPVERAAWEAAGVDPAAEAEAVGAALEELRAARAGSRRADVRLRWARTRVAVAADAGHAWLRWLATVIEDARREGARPAVLLDVRVLRRRIPTVTATLGRLREVVPDVARERDALALGTGVPARLDEGRTHLAALEEAQEAERRAAAAERATRLREEAARARWKQVFERLDRRVARVAETLGRAPTGASRDVVRAEARRRDAAARRREEGAAEA
jgi:hypothetical protein